jgi:hypothetical protein
MGQGLYKYEDCYRKSVNLLCHRRFSGRIWLKMALQKLVASERDPHLSKRPPELELRACQPWSLVFVRFCQPLSYLILTKVGSHFILSSTAMAIDGQQKGVIMPLLGIDALQASSKTSLHPAIMVTILFRTCQIVHVIIVRLKISAKYTQFKHYLPSYLIQAIKHTVVHMYKFFVPSSSRIARETMGSLYEWETMTSMATEYS